MSSEAIGPCVRQRLTFAKTGVGRFIGHLDLQRSLERALRRARVRVRHSGGFHPHPRMQFAAALPLGLIGRAELVDLWLEEPRFPEVLQAALVPVMPPGLSLLAVAAVPEGAPSLARLLRAGDYEVTLDRSTDGEALARNVARLLRSESLPRERRDKAYDLRPLIERLELVDRAAEAGMCLSMRLSLAQGRTGRPEEVLRALDLDPNAVQIERVRLVLA